MSAIVSKFKAYAYLRRDPCSYCGGPGGTIDHITALSRGGSSDDPRNMAGACLICNEAKGNWPLLPFLLLRAWVSTATARMEG